MKQFVKVNPRDLDPFVKEPMSDDEKRNYILKHLIRGFLLLSIPGFLLGFGLGAWIF